MASACLVTLLTTGRCNLQRSAVSATGWLFSLATTKSREEGGCRESEGKVMEESR